MRNQFNKKLKRFVYGIGNINSPFSSKGLSCYWPGTFDGTSLINLLGTNIPQVDEDNGEAIYDFSVLNDVRLDKSNATYWGASLDAYFYYDAGNPYHYKLKDFNYKKLNAQITFDNAIFLKADAITEVSNEIDNIYALLIYSVAQTGANLTQLKTYSNIHTVWSKNVVVNGNFGIDDSWNKGAAWSISGGTANITGFSTNDVLNQSIPYANVNQSAKVYFSVVENTLVGSGTALDLPYTNEVPSFTKEELTIGNYIENVTVLNAFFVGFRLRSGMTGGSLKIDNVKVELYLEDYYKKSITDVNLSIFLNNFTPTKLLTKIILTGDSITANAVGGGIPVVDDEGIGKRPPRLGYNTVPRRIYDYIKNTNSLFNNAIYRRIDDGDWTFGTPANWTQITGNEFLYPDYVGGTYETRYKYTQTANEYAEITIPDGYENCAFIFHKDDNEFSQDYDNSISITLNGGDISACGNSTVNLYKTKYSAGDVGNPFYMEQYSGLPSGNNTIRITKSNNSKTLVLWGVMYWTGNTFTVLNCAAGGHDQYTYYTNILQSYVLDNVPDVVFYQIPGFNELNRENSLAYAKTYFDLQINAIKAFSNNNILFPTHPWGNNGLGENYYLTRATPVNIKEFYEYFKQVAISQQLSYADLFSKFEELIIKNGGSLYGGEGGDNYTTDGLHLNVNGTEIFANYINDLGINNKLN